MSQFYYESEDEMQKKEDSGMILAVVLIAVGMLALLKQLGDFSPFTAIHMHHFFTPFKHMFSGIGSILFSWQTILIITGIILIAGRRSAGVVLVVLGGIFLLIKILHFPLFTSSILIPALLVGIGIALILKTSLRIN